MNSKDILKADMLDILFDNRNKQYGAYTLRKYYNNRLVISLAIALSLVFLLFLLASNIDHEVKVDPVQYQSTVVKLTDVLEPKPKPQIIEPQEAKPQIKVAQQKFIDRITIVENPVKPDVPVIGLTTNISDHNEVGPDPGLVPSVKLPSTGNNTIIETVTFAAPIQREPEFPGGMKAWIDFLNRNLTVPSELEAGEKKTVMIRFQVSAEGVVTGFEVLQSGGKIYDNEVIRVLKRMPKWKPAIQNNLPVARAFTQPVTFMGVEN
jgi:protein TonB